MADFVEVYFDRIVPGAADQADRFIGAVHKRIEQQHLPVKFEVNKNRAGTLSISSEFGGRHFEIFALVLGTSLHVGWILSSFEMRAGGFLSGTDAGQRAASRTSQKMGSPDAIRTVNGLLGAVQWLAFLPVLQQLAKTVDYQVELPLQGSFV